MHTKKRAEVALAAVRGDEEGAARKAVMNVVQIWLDRLQLVSVIVRGVLCWFVRVCRADASLL